MGREGQQCYASRFAGPAQTQKEKNAALELEITRLEGEADSLRHGSEALESRAREKLNMIRENEYLIRIMP